MYNPPYTPSEYHSPDEERCHYTIKVLDRISEKSVCLVSLTWELHPMPQASIFWSNTISLKDCLPLIVANNNNVIKI